MAKSNDVENGKVAAILSYITLIGWIVALILNNDKKSAFAKFHLRQSLMLNIAFLIGMIPVIGGVLVIAVLVFVIIGLISAINGEEKKVPLVGEKAQEWFKGL